MTEKEIKKAISIIKNKHNSPIIREYNGYIILAQSERDYLSKKNSIDKGCVLGFYTVELLLKNFKKKNQQINEI